MMDPTSLRVFVTVADKGSLTRAVETLNLSQPAASLQLKKLQDEIGVTLFERTPRGMRLTPAGQKLLPQARRALQGLEDFHSSAMGMSGQIQGRLKIGTIVDPEFLRLGAWLKDLSSTHPGLQFDLQQGISGAVSRRVQEGALDVAFVLGLPDFEDLAEGLHVEELVDCHYRVIAPKGWGPQIDGKSWAELAALPWVGTPADSVHHRLLSRTFADAGVEPRIAARVDVESSMLDLVRSGVALSLARDNLALAASHQHGVAVARGVQLHSVLGLVCRRQRIGEPPIKAAFEAVRRVWLA